MSYLDDPKVKAILERARKLREDKTFIVSDIIDKNNRQYVDLVQEGGGVLGIALVGYVCVLEAAGIRFLSLAGTSAGAINTMAMAAIGRMEDEKANKLLQVLNDQNLFEFVDGPASVRTFIRAVVEKPWHRWAGMAWGLGSVWSQLRTKLGLNPGDKFEAWMKNILDEQGIYTTEDLIRHRKHLPDGLRHRTQADVRPEAALVVIASDVTTKTKVEFPRMANHYWKNPSLVTPAKYVRASMSIPGFFFPFTLRDIPTGPDARVCWDAVHYTGDIPKVVRFVDGGMLSNFPINVFHRRDGGEPSRPTFGVRLSAYREKESDTGNLFSFADAMVSTMRQSLDFDFLLRNPDFKRLICKIDADEQFNWLDFNMPQDKRIALFALGCERAIEFLEQWHTPGQDWAAYKELRRAGFV